MCLHFDFEKGFHIFILMKNMDPSPQPPILAKLTQAKEMLIARVTPVLQVTHTRGGQYKYSGHTIRFAQGIMTISTLLLHHLHDLEVVIV